MPAPNSTPIRRQLRFSFDTWEQAAAHIHSLDGRQLIFYPHQQVSLAVGDRVVLALAVDGAEQASLAGKLYSRGTGSGVWIELFSPRPIAELKLAEAARRAHRRVGTDKMVRLRGPAQSAIVTLVDVSVGGARVAHAGGAWAPGTEVVLERFGREAPLRGRVTWSDRGDVAMQFTPDPRGRLAAGALFEEVARTWEGALEVRHSSECRCDRGGAVRQPLAPRVARNRLAKAS